MNTLTRLPPLSLYVHIPWCIQKCPYCDFNSHTARAVDENAYIQALLTDLQTELPHVWGRNVHSIFIGGGTPSIFQAASIDRLLSGIRALITINPDAEITLEANPGTFEVEKFRDFRAAGINRLSIGVQSFHDAHLKTIGRIHHGNEARTALECAAAIFPRVNADLMYALPHQSALEAREDVRMALSLGITHISAYQLTLEPNTPFGHTPPKGLPEDDQAYDIERAVHDELAQAGFQRYETSAFARDPKHRAQHNLNYWQFGDYIGIGAGAHGKISRADGIERTVRSRHPAAYLHAMHHQPSLAITRRAIETPSLPFEFMMNALRLVEGVPAHYFGERTGLSFTHISQKIMHAQRKGLLDSDPRYLRATALGQRFLNDLIEIFL